MWCEGTLGSMVKLIMLYCGLQCIWCIGVPITIILDQKSFNSTNVPVVVFQFQIDVLKKSERCNIRYIEWVAPKLQKQL